MFGENLYIIHDKVNYMAYPRAMALSEIGWSPAEKKNYADFRERISGMFG